MDIAPVWQRFSKGSPKTTVLVLENQLHQDSRSAVYNHTGLNAENIEFIQVSNNAFFKVPADGADTVDDNVVAMQTDATQAFGKAKGRGEVPAANEGFCTFVSRGMAEARNHDLHMAALIGGQPLLGVSGVAPGVRLALHSGSIGFDGRNQLDTNELASIIPKRSDIRVINVSQAGTDPTEPHWAYYQRLREFAMRVGARSPMSSSDPHSRILVVAAAGNRPRSHSFDFKVDASLDYRIPRQAIYTNRSVKTGSLINLSPHVPSLNNVPKAPLLMVGAVQFDRALPSFGRIDSGIDLFAPSGTSWGPDVFAAEAAPSSTSKDWNDCVCDLVRERQHSLADPQVADLARCEKLKGITHLKQLLGVPVIDYHARSGAPESKTGRALCRRTPTGACQTVISGTSGAAALVSGVAALMFSLDPSLSGEEAARLLRTSAMNNSSDGLPVLNPMAALHAVQHRMINRFLAALSRKDLDWLDKKLAATFRLEDASRKFGSEQRREQGMQALINSYGRSNWRFLRLHDAAMIECEVGTFLLPQTIGRELSRDRPCAPLETFGNALFQHTLISDGKSLRSARFIWVPDNAPNKGWSLAGLRIEENRNVRN